MDFLTLIVVIDELFIDIKGKAALFSKRNGRTIER